MRIETGRSHERMPPLKLLCGQLGMSINKSKEREPIKVNKDTVSKIRRELGDFRKSKKLIDKAIIYDILSKLNEQESVCNRLDNVTFEVIVAVLLQAEYSQEKELCLLRLTTSLYDETDHLEARKIYLCSALMLQLLQCFVNKNESNRIRRWVGIFLRELIDDNEKNRQKFLMSPEDIRRELGSMFISKENEIIRVVCSHLLRASKFEHADVFFPVGLDPSLIAQFPNSYQTIREWDTSFQQFMDIFLTATPSVQSDDVIVFAHQMETNLPVKFVLDHHINMLLEDNGGISIYQSRVDGNSDEFIDIPLETISQITRIDGVLKKTNRDTLYSFNLILREHSKLISTHNGISVELRSVEVYNFAKSEAEFQRRRLMMMCQRLRSLASWSQSSGSPIVVNHETRNGNSSFPTASSRVALPMHSGIATRRSRLLLSNLGQRTGSRYQSQYSFESKQNSSKGGLEDDLRERISHFVTTSPAELTEEPNTTLVVEDYFTGFQDKLGLETGESALMIPDDKQLGLNDVTQQDPTDPKFKRMVSHSSKPQTRRSEETSSEIDSFSVNKKQKITMERPRRIESASMDKEHHQKYHPKRNSNDAQRLNLVESLDGHVDFTIPKKNVCNASGAFKSNKGDNNELTDPPSSVLAKKATKVANSTNERIILQRSTKQPLKAKKPLEMTSVPRTHGTQPASVPVTRALQSSLPNSTTSTLPELNKSISGTAAKDDSIPRALRDRKSTGLSPTRNNEGLQSTATRVTNISKSKRRSSLPPVLNRSSPVKQSKRQAAKLANSKILELASIEQEDYVTPAVKKASEKKSMKAKTKVSQIIMEKRDSGRNDPNNLTILRGASQETNYKKAPDFLVEDPCSEHVMNPDPVDDFDFNQICPGDDEMQNLQKYDARRLGFLNDGIAFESFEHEISTSKEVSLQSINRLAEKLSSMFEYIHDVSKADAKDTRLKMSVIDGSSSPQQLPRGVTPLHVLSSPELAQLPVLMQFRAEELSDCAIDPDFIVPKGTVDSNLEELLSDANDEPAVPEIERARRKRQVDGAKRRQVLNKRRTGFTDDSFPIASLRQSPRLLAQKKNSLNRSDKDFFQNRSRPESSSFQNKEVPITDNAFKPKPFITESSIHKKVTTETSGILRPSGLDLNLVNEHQYRKPHLICYGIKGPKNQGISSPIELPSVLTTKSTREVIHSQKPTKFHVPSGKNDKRTREAQDIYQDEQDAKQKNMTDKRAKAEKQLEMEEIGLTNSQPILIPTYESQGSRVNEYGSPLPLLSSARHHSSLNKITTKNLGHVKIATTETRNPYDHDDREYDQINNDHLSEIAREDPPAVMTRRIQQFNTGDLTSSPRVVEDVVPRKVLYQIPIDSSPGSIKPKIAFKRKPEMLDPFTESTLDPPMSDFAKRLKLMTQDSTALQAKITVNKSTAPLVGVSEDPEKTLINVENEPLAPGLTSPSEYSSTSSNESDDDYTPSPLQAYQITPEERWRNALKPHQRNVVDSLRQITNNLVQHLITQEEAIEDIVDDYRRNGGKLVTHMVNKVTERRKRAYHEIEGLKKELRTDYKKSRRGVLEAQRKLKAAPVKDMEKRLVEQSDIALKMIAAAKSRTV